MFWGTFSLFNINKKKKSMLFRLKKFFSFYNLIKLIVIGGLALLVRFAILNWLNVDVLNDLYNPITWIYYPGMGVISGFIRFVLEFLFENIKQPMGPGKNVDTILNNPINKMDDKSYNEQDEEFVRENPLEIPDEYREKIGRSHRYESQTRHDYWSDESEKFEEKAKFYDKCYKHVETAIEAVVNGNKQNLTEEQMEARDFLLSRGHITEGMLNSKVELEDEKKRLSSLIEDYTAKSEICRFKAKNYNRD
jgi:hypothetical protein